MSQKLKLVRRIITLAVFVTLIVLLFRWCTKKDDPGFTIANTPMHVELVRSIAEISTISYKDEVVVDSVELYTNMQEQIAGNSFKLIDPQDFKYGLRSSSIRRRLTLLVKGEIKYGFDLKKKPVQIIELDSIVNVFLPDPQIVDIQVTPSSTEFFLENGAWNDKEVAAMHNKARQKLVKNAEMLELQQKTKDNMTSMMKKMIGEGKKVNVVFGDQLKTSK